MYIKKNPEEKYLENYDIMIELWQSLVSFSKKMKQTGNMRQIV